MAVTDSKELYLLQGLNDCARKDWGEIDADELFEMLGVQYDVEVVEVLKPAHH